MLLPDAVLAAQGSRGSAVAAGVGVSQSAQRVTGASPYRYSGIGPEVMFGYYRQTEATASSIAFTSSTAGLQSRITQNSFPRERFLATQLDVRYERAAGAFLRGRWMLGADVSGRAEVVEHLHSRDYDADYFEFLAFRFGPVIRGTWAAGRSTISNQLTVPLVGAVDFPWSNSQSNGAGIDLELVSPASVRSLDNIVRFRRRSDSRESWVYRFTYLDHVEGQRHRVVRQSLSITVDVRRWGVPP